MTTVCGTRGDIRFCGQKQTLFCTKELSSLRKLSSLHKVAYFYDVGSTYAIDQQINHLHNDIANMWRNNVLPYAIEDNIERKKK